MGKVRRMFPGGNTSEGFYSFHDNIIDENRNMLYILKGMPGGGKSSLMKYIGQKAIEKDYDVEFHHCPSDPESIDGLVIVQLNIALVDGTFPHIIDPVYPGLIDKLVDLGKFIDEKKIKEHKDEIFEAKANNRLAYRKAYAYFKGAKCIYDEIIEHNKNGVDFKRVNELTEGIIEEIYYGNSSWRPEDKFYPFTNRHLFSNANTPDGFVDYTYTILEEVKNIYYIEGEIGTGKSTLINRIKEEGIVRGYKMEVYHNATIPKKIESLFIKELNTYITSNKYGLKYPHKKIDLNQYFDKNIIDEKDYNMYELLIKTGLFSLEKARENHHILERCYRSSIDYHGVDRIKESLLEEILE